MCIQLDYHYLVITDEYKNGNVIITFSTEYPNLYDIVITDDYGDLYSGIMINNNNIITIDTLDSNVQYMLYFYIRRIDSDNVFLYKTLPIFTGDK